MRSVGFYFQHINNYPGACALRAESIIKSFHLFQDAHLTVYTNTPLRSLHKNSFRVIRGLTLKNENESKLITRLTFELFNGVYFALRAFIFRHDVVVVSSPSYFIGLIMGISRLLVGKNICLDIRDLYPEILQVSGLLSKKSWPYRILNRATQILYQKAVFISVTNESIRRHLIDRGIQENKITVIPNGIVDEQLEISSAKYKNFTVVVHGILGRYQDVELLREIILSSIEKDIHFCVIGYGIKSYLIEDLDVPNLTFLGKLPNREVIVELSKCHLGLSLRNDDWFSNRSFPVKNWEFLGASIPSLSYPTSDASRFAEEHHIGKVLLQNDVTSIVEAISFFKENERYYEEMSKNCLQLRTHYTRSKLGEKLVENLISSIEDQIV